MKIALAQLDCEVGDLDGNCAKITNFAADAARQNCQLILFPEMTDTGYDTVVIPQVAQSWAGKPFSIVSAAARDNTITIGCGLAERQGEAIYNSFAMFDPTEKLLAKYRKTHLFTAEPLQEDTCFTAGSELVNVTVNNINCGLSICYDLRFSDLYRSLTRTGAELLINSAAWPASRGNHWDVLTRARAIENQAYFIGINRAGTDADIQLAGHSCIIAPTGELIVEGTATEEELLIGEIDIHNVTTFRQQIPAVRSWHR